MIRSLFQQETLGEHLLGSGVLTKEEWDKVDDQISKTGDSEVIAASKVYGQKETINRAIAEYLQVPYIELLELPKPSTEILNLVKRDIVAKEHCFAFAFNKDKTVVKMAFVDPSDTDMIENIELRINRAIEPYHASWNAIETMQLRSYGQSESMKDAERYLQSIGDTGPSTIETAVNLGDPNSPVVNIVNRMLEQAAKMKASDIHIEPFDGYIKIRYRVDGHLIKVQDLPIGLIGALIARLKVMGGMDISEKRIPQDGRITFMVDKIEYDIRVSMLPTVYGEKCVMRLALRANLQRDKKDLGLTDYDLKIFDKVFANPNGIILVTGPTGSGKSTTLYTALSELCTEDVNIVTVEDPVEANVDGINQVQTNVRAGLTFAAALRSILRQDPDIIMIGEIRDTETAEIAVQAAVTGHLVVSTLHTNSASATVTRLVNMGLEPYMVADSVVGIFAQRLVRRLCPRCKVAKKATQADLEELGLKPGLDVTIYEKGGCAHCNHTGYSGRMAVYEIMDVGPEIKEMIMKNATTAEIKRTAIAAGMHTLHRSAAEQVVKGITSIEEMRRVSTES